MIPNIVENLMQTVGREKLLFQLVGYSLKRKATAEK